MCVGARDTLAGDARGVHTALHLIGFTSRSSARTRVAAVRRVTEDVRRVLIVEDNDELRRDLAVHLSSQGWHVETARTLSSATVLAARQLPDVVVSELLLPDVRGYRFVDSLRDAVPHRIAVVGVTRMPAELFERAKELGFDEIHAKPIDASALEARLLELCRR